MFQLPFPVVAMEDDASVCLLMDSERDQIGLEGRRYFVDMMSTDTDTANYNWSAAQTGVSSEEAAAVKEEFAARYSNPYVITCGYLEDMHYEPGTGRMVSHGVVTSSYILNKKEIIEAYDQDAIRNLPAAMVNDLLRNPVTAHEELIMLSCPEYFILEESPAKTIKQKKGSRKIPRSHQRSMFTFLQPVDIRRKLGLEHPGQDRTRNSPVPHERRRHLRRLRKESGYKEDRVVPVKACWIGASENMVKGRRYRVRLDL
jgi:hypothetical protein